jgi:hypothetical protein|tara:strand:- start:498 stop:1046 length:549 start_codon:yes stop_codon:yes gene_type:complete
MTYDKSVLTEKTEDQHEYKSVVPGEIYPISEKQVNGLSGQETSDLMWFKVSNLWLRSGRLRPAKEASKISTLENPEGDLNGITASIHDIAETYRRRPLFNSEPVLVCYEGIQEEGLDMLLYEGRHRGAGAYLAEREYILGRQICNEHSTVLSQNSPSNKKYFQQPIFNISEFTEMFRDNMDV